ncbi:transporter substrate-binding domain-containing protein [Vibrio owensii]|uniref:ATP-binding protein n=1 Tax=Vibrio owensii TaxID=696485 RepID=UPI00104FB636|nr:ATP-binding protein [Vibrio owensii]TDE22639.1 transporter substrate-binding domain-containing protein [Vibrio owensii]
MKKYYSFFLCLFSVCFILMIRPTYADVNLTEEQQKYLKSKKNVKLGVLNKAQLPYWSGDKSLPFGLQHEVSKLVFNKLGLKIDYVEYSSISDVLDAIKNNSIDLAVGYRKTKDREADFIFTSPIYTDQFVGWIKDDMMPIDNIKNIKWGCYINTSSCESLEALGFDKVIKSSNRGDLYNKFKNGKVDAIIDIYAAMEPYMSKNIISGGKVYYDKQFGVFKPRVILNKGDVYLENIINEVIKDIQSEREGSILEVFEKYDYSPAYNSLTFDNVPLNQVINYTIEENLFPLSFYDEEEKKYSGYIHDLLSKIGHRTPLKFKYIPPNGRNIEQMLLDGIVDVLPARSASLYDDSRFISTDVYTKLRFAQIETIKPYDIKKIAILDRMDVLPVDILEKNIKVYTSMSSILDAINKGHITNAYVNEYLVESLLLSTANPSFRLVPSSGELDVNLVMVFRNTDEKLQRIFTTVLNSYIEDEVESLWRPYQRMEFNWGIDKEHVFAYGIFSLLALLVISLGFYIVYIKMKENVESSKLTLTNSETKNKWLIQLINSIPSMICIFDQKGNVELINERFKDLMNRSNFSDKKQFIDHLTDDIKEDLNQEFDTEVYISNTESSLFGTHYRIVNSLIENKSEKRDYYLMVFTDISEQKDKEKALIDANKKAHQSMEAQQHFLAVVSHELRTPISAMMGLMEILSRNINKRENKSILLNAINSAKRLKILVNDILDYSKLDANQVAIVPEHCNIAFELSPVLRGFEASAGLKGVEFIVDWHPTPNLHVNVDVMRLNQVVSNIVSNAIKFTEKGFVSVRIDVLENQFMISVRDTGIGMSKQQIETIFDPFVQAEDSIARHYGGTGLGMSIVSNIVALMGGTVSISSELKLGTLVEVVVPISAEAISFDIDKYIVCKNTVEASWASELNVTHELAPTNTLGNTYPDYILQKIEGFSDEQESEQNGFFSTLNGHVLVVEDDPINRFLVKKQLKALGLKSTMAVNGIEALKILRQTTDTFDLIITDCHMPELNGFQLTETIRRGETRFKAIPIIACTADNSYQVEDSAHKVGVSEVMYKPYDLPALYWVLSHYLEDKSCEKTTGILDPSMISPPLDFESASHWLGDLEEDQKREMASVVVTSFRQSLIELQQSDSDIGHVAHRVKGAAGALNIESLIKIANNLEKKPTDANLKRELIESLSTIVESAIRFLDGEQGILHENNDH